MNHKGVIFEGKEYSTIVNSMYKFRRFSYNGKEDWMNIFDQPGQMFFKILFHFDTGDDANGLLGITNMVFSADRTAGFNNIINQSEGTESYRNVLGDPQIGQKYLANTAFHFLLRNNELTRANMLIDFVELLSEINSNHPWYWKSISGLEGLLERKILTKEAKIEDESPRITIKCLEDAYDSRVGTLLDLYKAICFDYMNKREIVPANLRKFDMDICIVQVPTKTMHKITTKDSLIGNLADDLLHKNNPPTSDVKYQIPNDYKEAQKYVSCKIFELKNCELVFNSSKTGYSELSNEEGFKNEYTIEIAVDDVYENRFNEMLGYNIGDFMIFGSMAETGYKYYGDMGGYDDGNPMGSSVDTSRFITKNNINSKLDIAGIVENVVGNAISRTKSSIRGLTLGNLHTTSLSSIANFIENPSQSISTMASAAMNNAVNSALAGSNKRDELTSSLGKKLPGYPTFEEKMANIKGKFNSNRNLFNSI